MSAKPSPSKPAAAADAGKKSPAKGGADFTCSKLLEELLHLCCIETRTEKCCNVQDSYDFGYCMAGLASTMKELSKVPDGQELDVYLKLDVCRSRYDFPDLKGHIAPLIKQQMQPGRRDTAPVFRPFPDDALRQAFAISATQPGPPLPLLPQADQITDHVPANKRKRGAK